MMAVRGDTVTAVSDPTEPDQPVAPRKERALASKTVAALAVAALLVAFGVANNNEVKVDWLIFSTSTSLILVIGVAALLGALIGALAVRHRRR
jgi:uncharacterized integral membrane protein